jgi:hypothetical protein
MKRDFKPALPYRDADILSNLSEILTNGPGSDKNKGIEPFWDKKVKFHRLPSLKCLI